MLKVEVTTGNVDRLSAATLALYLNGLEAELRAPSPTTDVAALRAEHKVLAGVLDARLDGGALVHQRVCSIDTLVAYEYPKAA